jgi:hypothetical protein
MLVSELAKKYRVTSSEGRGDDLYGYDKAKKEYLRLVKQGKEGTEAMISALKFSGADPRSLFAEITKDREMWAAAEWDAEKVRKTFK